MSTGLRIKHGGRIDTNLEEQWDYSDLRWVEFIQTLDENIIKVVNAAYECTTTLTFNTEEALTLFILKWS
jgi:hypothetical protein